MTHQGLSNKVTYPLVEDFQNFFHCLALAPLNLPLNRSYRLLSDFRSNAVRYGIWVKDMSIDP